MMPARMVIGQKNKPENEASSRASWNTPRSDSRTRMSYGSRMALSFALTSLMTVGILVCVISVVWGGVFSEYTRANVTELARLTSEKLASIYETSGEWTLSDLASLSDSTMVSDDIGLQVMAADGTVLYDDTWPAAPVAAELKRLREQEEAAQLRAEQAEQAADSVEDEQDAEDAAAAADAADAAARADAKAGEEEWIAQAHSLTSSAPTDAEGAVTEPVVTSDGETVGSVRLWVMGSDVLLTKADAAFRDRTFNAIVIAAVVAVAISLLIGLLVSRMLVKPIGRITSTAKQIRDGDLSARTNLRGEDEIDQLGETFDEMATSLEKDLKHERRLTSDVAHELRTPLMAMLATVEAMQDGVYPTDAEHLETVASETRRLARLVQQMLDLSRMENRTAPLNLEPVDVVSLTRNIVNAQEQLFISRDLRLRFSDETDGRSATIEIDPDMITQAIINLMSNAMRYTPEGGWVVVSVMLDRKNVLVSVADTGIGIAKEDLSRIFGRFWRADSSRAREAGGLGVGLAVTKQIIERHHGFISVESELGKGTTFTIHLPREHVPE